MSVVLVIVFNVLSRDAGTGGGGRGGGQRGEKVPFWFITALNLNNCTSYGFR